MTLVTIHGFIKASNFFFLKYGILLIDFLNWMWFTTMQSLAVFYWFSSGFVCPV